MGDSSSDMGTEATLNPSETLSRAVSESVAESEAILEEADRSYTQRRSVIKIK